MRTIDNTHRAAPEQRERYAALYHFRYHPKFMERGPMQSRPDFHETTRAIVSMNREAGQNPQMALKRNKSRDDLDPEKLKWLSWLSLNWEWYFAVNRHSENFGFHTVAPSRIDGKASHGKPCSFFGRMGFAVKSLVECILVDQQFLVGDQDGLGLMTSAGFAPR